MAAGAVAFAWSNQTTKSERAPCAGLSCVPPHRDLQRQHRTERKLNRSEPLLSKVNRSEGPKKYFRPNGNISGKDDAS